jgi:uncharacterized membrane protein YfcA
MAGIVMGLFGGGIGLVLVPVLLWLLRFEGVPSDVLMHLAIGTAVAAIVAIGAVASYRHHKAGAVNWRLAFLILRGLFFGVVLGAITARHVSSQGLMFAFGLIVFFLAFYVWFSSKSGASKKDGPRVSAWCLTGSGVFIGFMGSVLGANPFCVPILKRLGYDIREAIATTVIVGSAMAVGIVVMFIVTGWGVPGLPSYSTGFVDWALFLPLALGGSLFTPVGVYLAHRIPKSLLQVSYGVLLLIIGVKMILASGLISLF